MARHLGNKFIKKYLLSLIYLGRRIFAAIFIMIPITPTTVVVIGISMGSLWLTTIPLTSRLIAHIYGIKYTGGLFGIVFFSHQLGSFSGVWLGGVMYDIYGSYTFVWWVSVCIGAFSVLIHLPVRKRPLVMRSA